MARLLVIEDDSLMRQTLQEMLALTGHEVLVAENGELGTELARETLPDLIVSDWKMPRMNGEAVLLNLRQHEPTAAIPFIFLTGEEDPELYRKVMEHGADDYLVKPVRFEKLMQAINARLKRHSTYNLQVEQLRRHVTQVVSHEFNTPLNAILGYSSLLNDMLAEGQMPDMELLQEAVQSIQQAGHRLHHLNSNFILYSELVTKSKTEHQLLRQQETSEDWSHQLEHRLQTLAERYRRAGDLQLSLADIALGISPVHLIKMIEELVDNAFKFSQPGQPVVVECAQESEFVAGLFSITDQGRGFAPQKLQDMPVLQQIDRQHYMQEGVGLGWPIVKLIAQIYDARFQIESEPGKGTCVTLLVPPPQAAETANGKR
ncbi:MAG: hybrid sensor histidine kinase/response regulator [Verrucomicrobiota bacterium JB022]|nr:hybrid sensor histidine kinase/response regulator [Verrucomicrobiota bacterium JB022]